ncbi:right-handed parallel beta-helix repeat-containing protein [Actinoplanes sp. NPDC026619]|uniref:right-handed parallel beta-helix repeat-containing protein n=1 Tax=Actinoplanes sp. NPDC026619 TaxID=3155798 RepID=UPI0034115770
MRTIRIALSIGGVAAMVVAATAGVGHATGRAAPCAVPSALYPTIQSAVTAPTCAIVKVAPGNYTENVAAARSVTISGAQAGKDARSRRGTGESVLTGNFSLAADNITIDGFTLNGPPGDGTAAFVMQGGNSGDTIQNNIVNNTGKAASITTSRSVFRRNVVKNTSTATDGFQGNSSAIHEVTISENRFSGANPAIYNADVTFIEGSSDLTVSSNQSTGDGTLVALFATTNGRVLNNTIVGAANSSAVYIGGENGKITVTGNTISSAGSGVQVTVYPGRGKNSGPVGISGNTLRNNQYGVKVAAGSTTSVVQVTHNSITGNSAYGVFNDPASGASTNATCNWWGAIAGPGSPRGDKASTGVTYKPWLLLPVLSGICR